jgi:hypothetical protein
MAPPHLLLSRGAARVSGGARSSRVTRDPQLTLASGGHAGTASTLGGPDPTRGYPASVPIQLGGWRRAHTASQPAEDLQQGTKQKALGWWHLFWVC